MKQILRVPHLETLPFVPRNVPALVLLKRIYTKQFFQSDVLLADFSGTNYADSRNIMPLKLQRLEDETRRVA